MHRGQFVFRLVLPGYFILFIFFDYLFRFLRFSCASSHNSIAKYIHKVLIQFADDEKIIVAVLSTLSKEYNWNFQQELYDAAVVDVASTSATFDLAISPSLYVPSFWILSARN
jgi:hypothetical protein